MLVYTNFYYNLCLFLCVINLSIMTTTNLSLLKDNSQPETFRKNSKFSTYGNLRSKTGLKVLIAFLIVLSLFIVTHIFKFPGSVGYLSEITHGQKTLDLQASFSSTATYQRLEAFGEIGRQMYMRTMLTVDLIFPVSMFIFLFLFSKYVSQRWGMKPAFGKALRSLSIAYVTLDFLENLTIFFLLSNFPDRLEFMGSYIGFLTVGKRISMMGAIFIPVILLVVGKVSGRFRKMRIGKG